MPASSGTVEKIYLAFLKLQRKLESNRVAGTATDVTAELNGLKQHIETAKLEDAPAELKPPFFPGAFVEEKPVPAPEVVHEAVAVDSSGD